MASEGVVSGGVQGGGRELKALPWQRTRAFRPRQRHNVPRQHRVDVRCEAALSGERTHLGKSQLQVSRLGIGTLAWGDPGQGFGDRYNEAQLIDTLSAATEAGINFFDTAEVYGYQGTKSGLSSESIIGRATRSAAPKAVVGTKFFTIPWTNFLVGGGFRIGRQAVIDALRASLGRLQLDKVDLYQVHFPFPTYGQKLLSEALAEAVELGMVSNVGVCNYSAEQMEELHGLLAARGIHLVSNQVKYSLLERSPERSGLLQRCRDMDVTLIAHSPLQQGLLTGRYVESGGPKQAEAARPLLKLMQFVGMLLGKTPSQVALNYLISKGALPIPGAKSPDQAREHAGALGWRLDDNEVAILEEKLAALQL